MGGQCTLAADLYSFGVLLIELTTQQLTTRGDRRLPQAPGECPQVDCVCVCVCVCGGGALPRGGSKWQCLSRLLFCYMHTCIYVAAGSCGAH